MHSEAKFCSNLDLDTFSNNIVGTSYHLKGSLFKINPKTANDKTIQREHIDDYFPKYSSKKYSLSV